MPEAAKETKPPTPTKEQLVELLQAGKVKEFNQLRPPGFVDLTAADLTEADLTAADLTRVILTKANLSAADLTAADLSATLGLNLQGATIDLTAARTLLPHNFDKDTALLIIQAAAAAVNQ